MNSKPTKEISAETHPSHRPESLAAFVGQEPLKQRLSIAIEASQKTGRTLPHCLLTSGVGGTGKTSIGMLVAKELGREPKIINSANLDKMADLMAVVAKVEPGDILLLDELHNLKKKTQEALYSVLEDFRVDIKTGDATNKIRSIYINRFTIIGASTKLGKLQQPFVDRFGIVHQLDFYSPEEIAEIIRRNTVRWKIPTPHEDLLMAISCRARGIPRVGLRLFDRCRDFADAKNGGKISAAIIESTMNIEGIDGRGLTEQDRRYLRILMDHYDGAYVGVNAIAASMNEDRETVESTIEPFLIRQGLVIRASRGRKITDDGLRVLTS